MTNKGYNSSDPWEDGDVLNATDLKDSIAGSGWEDAPTLPYNQSSIVSTIAHSATTFSAGSNGASSLSTIYQSTDTMATWTSKNTDLDEADARFYMVRARTAAAVGFAIEDDAAPTALECAYTADSGATWTTKTSANFGTALYDVEVYSSGMIVLAGNDGGGNHIVYSTDQGTTWNDPTTPPTTSCSAVSMASATVGYAVDSAGNIWKTADGCDTWTDTTDNAYSGSTTTTTILAIDTDTVIIATDGVMQKYVNSTNTVTNTGTSLHTRCSLWKATNGNAYLVSRSTTEYVGLLFRSTDSGTTWQKNNSSFVCRAGFPHIQKRELTEVGTTNTLLFGESGPELIFFRES